MPDGAGPRPAHGKIRKPHGAETLRPPSLLLVLYDLAGGGGWAHGGPHDPGDRDRATARKDARDERGIAARLAAPARARRGRQLVEHPAANESRRGQAAR